MFEELARPVLLALAPLTFVPAIVIVVEGTLTLLQPVIVAS